MSFFLNTPSALADGLPEVPLMLMPSASTYMESHLEALEDLCNEVAMQFLKSNNNTLHAQELVSSNLSNIYKFGLLSDGIEERLRIALENSQVIQTNGSVVSFSGN